MTDYRVLLFACEKFSFSSTFIYLKFSLFLCFCVVLGKFILYANGKTSKAEKKANATKGQKL